MYHSLDEYIYGTYNVLYMTCTVVAHAITVWQVIFAVHVLIFIIFVVDLAVTKNFHQQNLMSAVIILLYMRGVER